MEIKKLSEQAEQISKEYVQHNNIERTDDWFVLKLQEEMGELTQKYLMWKGQARQKGLSKDEIFEKLGWEIADVMGHILLLANNLEIDIEEVMEKKWLKWL